MNRFLDMDDIQAVHRNTMETEGGGGLALRDLSLAESAAAAPQASFAGEYLHEDVFSRAAALMFSLVCNHAFVDGNKRVGTLAALVYLEENGVEAYPQAEELEEVTLRVASGRMDKDELVEWFRRLGADGI